MDIKRRLFALQLLIGKEKWLASWRQNGWSMFKKKMVRLDVVLLSDSGFLRVFRHRWPSCFEIPNAHEEPLLLLAPLLCSPPTKHTWSPKHWGKNFSLFSHVVSVWRYSFWVHFRYMILFNFYFIFLLSFVFCCSVCALVHYLESLQSCGWILVKGQMMSAIIYMYLW